MFCPYVRKSYTRITGIHYRDGIDDDVAVEDGSFLHEHFENMECKREQCGVWSEGKCNYNGQ